MTDDIPTGVADAAALLVRDRGVEGAIAELQRRADASSDGDSDRALAALAWVRREVKE
jgi:hypothetical protein